MPTRLFLSPALLSSAAIALLLSVPAFAQQTPSNAAMPQQATPNAARQLSKQDQNFVKDAAIGGMAEVQLGKLAQQNGQSDQVKQFGAKMVQDHSNADNQLQSLASAQGLTLPQQLDRKHQETMDRLSRLHGAAFDRAYMKDMVKDHNEDVSKFRREAQSARDPAVKQFAAQTLPVLQQHDQLAHEVEHSLTATGSSRPPR